MKCTSLPAQKSFPKYSFSFFESVYYMTRRNCSTGNINTTIANVNVFVSCIGTVVHYGFTASIYKFNFATSVFINVVLA